MSGMYVENDTFTEAMKRIEQMYAASEARMAQRAAESEARFARQTAESEARLARQTAESEARLARQTAANEAQTQAQITEIRADSKRLEETTRIYIENFNQRLDDSLSAFKDSVNSLNNRIDRFINMFSWGAAVVGTIIACVQLYLAFK